MTMQKLVMHRGPYPTIPTMGTEKVIDIPDETLQEAIERHPRAWAIMTARRHRA
jgi:hypothetical protein